MLADEIRERTFAKMYVLLLSCPTFFSHIFPQAGRHQPTPCVFVTFVSRGRESLGKEHPQLLRVSE